MLQKTQPHCFTWFNLSSQGNQLNDIGRSFIVQCGSMAMISNVSFNSSKCGIHSLFISNKTESKTQIPFSLVRKYFTRIAKTITTKIIKVWSWHNKQAQFLSDLWPGIHLSSSFLCTVQQIAHSQNKRVPKGTLFFVLFSDKRQTPPRGFGEPHLVL